MLRAVHYNIFQMNKAEMVIRKYQNYILYHMRSE